MPYSLLRVGRAGKGTCQEPEWGGGEEWTSLRGFIGNHLFLIRIQLDLAGGSGSGAVSSTILVCFYHESYFQKDYVKDRPVFHLHVIFILFDKSFFFFLRIIVLIEILICPFCSCPFLRLFSMNDNFKSFSYKAFE